MPMKFLIPAGYLFCAFIPFIFPEVHAPKLGYILGWLNAAMWYVLCSIQGEK